MNKNKLLDLIFSVKSSTDKTAINCYHTATPGQNWEVEQADLTLLTLSCFMSLFIHKLASSSSVFMIIKNYDDI